MTTDPILWLSAAATALVALIIAVNALLRGWHGWLELKRVEIEAGRIDATPPSPGSRIEIADLKERVRKLEAIAAGVDF
ncbi:MAG: hypothetical protein JWN59_1700 [Sphingomonas bacterium]|nr:hypothetical protein [Sphingomonas bacterium]